MAAPEPIEWQRAYVRIQRLADQEVLALLWRSYRDIDRMLRILEKKPSISAMVRAEQLRMIQREMLKQQAIIYRNLGDIIRARRLEAAARASRLGSAIDDVLFGAAGDTEQARSLKRSLAASSQQSVDVAIARMTVSSIPLAQRIYRDQVWMQGRVQRSINSALARGLSAREFAKEARGWFRPDVPGGTRYAAFRLARTEINNAFHATSVMQADEKPWIEKMGWHLSHSHPKADTCDIYAKGGPGGDGIYRVRDVPRKPHPQCFCYITPVSPDEDEFLDNLVKGRYDTYLDSKMRTA